MWNTTSKVMVPPTPKTFKRTEKIPSSTFGISSSKIESILTQIFKVLEFEERLTLMAWLKSKSVAQSTGELCPWVHLSKSLGLLEILALEEITKLNTRNYVSA